MQSGNHPLVLLTGATGFIGRQLLPLLMARGPVRCMARDPSALRESGAETVQGDVLDLASLQVALTGVHTAYYLIHMMAAGGHFEDADRLAAQNFAKAAAGAGVKRIIYMGALGDEADPKLSPHIRSRHEAGRLLRATGVEVIELRASIVIGNGSTSYELIRSLTNRLPVMICPRWLSTPTQPIAIDDVLAYLLAALDLPDGDRTIEIGSPDVFSYGDLIREYARQRGLHRWLISVPVLTPYISSLWLALVTPAKFGVGRHLIEGLRNAMLIRDPEGAKAFSIRPLGVKEAIARAVAQESN